MAPSIIPTNDSSSEISPLHAAGQAANAAAARHVFDDYASRKAPQTLRRQRADLALFAAFLGRVGAAAGDLQRDPGAWRGVTWGLVAAFVQAMLADGYTISSINVRLSTVKTYVKLAAQADAISATEYALIRTVNGYRRGEAAHLDENRRSNGVSIRKGRKKAVPTVLSASQVKALKHQPDTPQGRRDRLIVCLAFDLGLRVGEIARLEVTAFNLTEGTLTFYRPKVGKVQTHRLTRDTLHAAQAYFEQDAPPAGKLLRGSRKGGNLTEAGMSERAITERFCTLAQAIGVDGVRAHDGRHTWATRAARNQTDAFALQEAGGWNSLAMPRRYVEEAKIANEGVKLGDE